VILVSVCHAVTCPTFPAPMPSQTDGASDATITAFGGDSDVFVFDLQIPLLFENGH